MQRRIIKNENCEQENNINKKNQKQRKSPSLDNGPSLEETKRSRSNILNYKTRKPFDIASSPRN